MRTTKRILLLGAMLLVFVAIREGTLDILIGFVAALALLGYLFGFGHRLVMERIASKRKPVSTTSGVPLECAAGHRMYHPPGAVRIRVRPTALDPSAYTFDVEHGCPKDVCTAQTVLSDVPVNTVQKLLAAGVRGIVPSVTTADSMHMVTRALEVTGLLDAMNSIEADTEHVRRSMDIGDLFGDEGV